MAWLVGGWQSLGTVVAKAALIYIVALLGLRFSQRRTLAQWTAIDFAAAVAIGAIVGRTAVASGQSFVIGAVALVTMLALHFVMSMARFSPLVAKLVDHRVRVLIDHGQLRKSQLRVCGVTENDVMAKLREQGVLDLTEVRYALYETKGDLTVIREAALQGGDTRLVEAALTDAAGFPKPRKTPGTDPDLRG